MDFVLKIILLINLSKFNLFLKQTSLFNKTVNKLKCSGSKL